jgi:flagellar biosynthesis/type III secretory pathway protein FliH
MVWTSQTNFWFKKEMKRKNWIFPKLKELKTPTKSKNRKDKRKNKKKPLILVMTSSPQLKSKERKREPLQPLNKGTTHQIYNLGLEIGHGSSETRRWLMTLKLFQNLEKKLPRKYSSQLQ